MAQEKTFVGISFGTLNSSVSIVGKGGKGETIANEDGDRNIPTCVAFTDYEELVGTQARVQANSNPRGTIFQFRNLVGKKYDDTEVQKHSSKLLANIVPFPQDESLPAYEVETTPEEDAQPVTSHYTVADVTAKYFAKLKETAEAYLGRSVEGVVVSTPVHFEEHEQNALREAVVQAGFETVHLVHEPVAAALAFDYNAKEIGNQSTKQDRTILVLDLGAHQFNATLLDSSNGLFSIVATHDDYALGGSQFDEVLLNFFKDEFRKKTRIDISDNRKAVAKLRAACEQTKRMLSQKDSAPCHVESLYDGMDYNANMIRGRFETLAEKLFTRCVDVVKNVLKEGGAAPTEVDEVLFVGGSARIPRFQSVIRSLFESETVFRTDLEPDEAISVGCATQAGLIASQESEYDSAIATEEVVRVPHLKKSVGLEGADGVFVPIIPKRAAIPARRTIEASNAVAKQSEIFLSVYEGDHAQAQENTLLGQIVLSDLPEASKVGELRVQITFQIERDEILTVVAKEKTQGKELRVKFDKITHQHK
ncbi:heat shock protein 70 family [Polychytrium aggregatum]|uniref:heat shock protein 70 family n=1 Tax=Polychytrium aggregatum TaxID=110093 RepID=UPI0022FE3286|nr:heat shock protein 70 family [Polychytrium aggregatum]KAI9204429.1 heat shock protein 70 family [Polychytrium aggregatum]